METFALDINKQKQERWKAYLFNIGMVSIPIIYDCVVPNSFIKSSYYFFVGMFILVNLLKEVFSEPTVQVSFDRDNQQVILTSKALFSRPKLKAIPFKNARLEYMDEGGFLIFKGSVKLCFMKDKMEVASIVESIKGFSKEAMNEMIKRAQDCNIPVSFN